MGGGIAPSKNTKTVVVLGAAYGGGHAAQIVAAGLPEGWKVIIIDRNSHANHAYVMPRYAVLPGHEYKAFIPLTNVFLTPPKPTHIRLQAHIMSIKPHHITLSKSFPELGFPTPTIPFDYAIYALGAQLPPPLNLWETSADGKPIPQAVLEGSTVYHGEKAEGCDWLKEKQKLIEAAPSVLVVGGGALGIQFATDIKSVYPSKSVTLLHSRLQLLPRFDHKMHEEILRSCKNLEIEVILGERLDLSTVGQKVVRTVTGRELSADLLLQCTGQAPNTGLLKAMDPATVAETSHLAHVLRTLQLNRPRVSSPTKSATDDLQKLSISGAAVAEALVKQELEEHSPYPHIFAIGDAADAFGAIAAGHNAYYQAEVAGRNVVRLIKRQEAEEAIKMTVEGSAAIEKAEHEPLEHYKPGPPAIKVSLGLTRGVYQVGPNVGLKTDGKPDLDAAGVWPFWGIKVEKDEDMRK